MNDVCDGSSPRTRRLLVAALLFAIFVAALLPRALGTEFGLPYLHHWDEPISASAGLKMLKTGDFEPDIFSYPSVLTYLCLGCDVVHYFDLALEEKDGRQVLTAPRDIKIGSDTGFFWDISHPSFYRWNRVMVAFLGALSVFLVHELTRSFSGKTSGLLAALLLAGFFPHMLHSRVVTPDGPMALFALAALLFAVRFTRTGHGRYYYLSLAGAGVAMGTKYTAFMLIASPLVALLFRWPRSATVRGVRVISLLAVPLAVFLLTNPFVLARFPLFIQQVTFEAFHYKVMGHAADSATPGLAHLRLQLGRMGDHISWPFFAAAVLGAMVLVRRRGGAVFLVSPLLYLYYLCQQKVGFHRNFIIIYPVLAVCTGVGCMFLFRRLAAVTSHRRAARVGAAALGALVAVLVGFQQVRVWKSMAAALQYRETRSDLIDWLNTEATKRPLRVGIARELRIHEQDLRRLKADHEVLPHPLLLARASEFDYLAAGEYACSHIDLVKRVNNLNALTPKDRVVTVLERPPSEGMVFPQDQNHRAMDAAATTYLDTFSINPKVLILRGRQPEPGDR